MYAYSARHIAGVLVVIIASGLLFSVSALNEHEGPAGTPDLSALTRNHQEQVKVLKNEVSSPDTQIQSYTSVAPQLGDEDVSTVRPTQIVADPDVRIILSDTPSGGIPESATPNDLVVHRQDIKGAVNVLWGGGAEAMTVQGVRITSRTVICCIGNVILVDGTSFSPSYMIQVIGDPITLCATVTTSSRMMNYQAHVTRHDLEQDMQTKDLLSFMPATIPPTVNYTTVGKSNG